MSFCEKFKRSQESQRYLEAQLRDLSVNVADHLGVPVSTVTVLYEVYGLSWRWVVQYEDLICRAPGLDECVQELQLLLRAEAAQ